MTILIGAPSPSVWHPNSRRANRVRGFVVGADSGTRLKAFNWSTNTGAVNTFVPSSQPPAAIESVACSPGWVAAMSASNLYLYRFNPYQGFLSLASTTALSGTGEKVRFARDGSALFLISRTTVRAYALSNDGLGSLYSNPTFTVTGEYRGFAVCPDDDIVALGGTAGSRVQFFRWIPGSGWGSSLGSGTGAASNCDDIEISPLINGYRYALSGDSAGFQLAVVGSSSVGAWSTKATSSNVDCVKFMPNIGHYAIGGRATPDLAIYALSAGTATIGTATASTNHSGHIYGFGYFPQGNGLVCAATASTYLNAYTVSSGGVLSALTSPGTIGALCYEAATYK